MITNTDNIDKYDTQDKSGGCNIVLTHTLSLLSKLDLKVGKKTLKLQEKIQDYQAYVFIVCWSYVIILADS